MISKSKKTYVYVPGRTGGLSPVTRPISGLSASGCPWPVRPQVTERHQQNQQRGINRNERFLHIKGSRGFTHIIIVIAHSRWIKNI